MIVYVVTEINSDLDDGWTEIRGIYDNEEAAIARMEELSDRISTWLGELQYEHGTEYDFTFMRCQKYTLNQPVLRQWGDVR